MPLPGDGATFPVHFAELSANFMVELRCSIVATRRV